MQWLNKVYGSVGEFGVFYGKFFALLARNSHRSNEKLFAADLFNKLEHLSEQTPNGASTGHFHKFKEHLESVGINQKTVNIWMDSTLFLDTSILKQMGMDQFRLLSIDGAKRNFSVLSDLKLASCIMHDGGIVIINDVMHKDFPGVAKGLKLYFDMYGENVLSPLIFIGNKLFLVAGQSLRNAYYKYIEDTLSVSLKLQLVKGGFLSNHIGFSAVTPFYVPK